jgi:hypothetical protein
MSSERTGTCHNVHNLRNWENKKEEEVKVELTTARVLLEKE